MERDILGGKKELFWWDIETTACAKPLSYIMYDVFIVSLFVIF
jgi:hypothetical protein